VACLGWSPDGKVIAVGWTKSGMSVWSLNGCRFLCTVAAGEEHKQSELLRGGVNALCWVARGYSLMVSEASRSSTLVDIPFVRSALGTTPSTHASSRVVMMGSSELWLLSHKSPIQNEFAWSFLTVPEAYIAENWPLERVAIGRDLSAGENIAVAGRRGFAVFNCASGRWKLFGNKKEEQAMRCTGLCWHDRLVVVAVVAPMPPTEGKPFRAQLYPRNYLA
jgi:WD40 repeat protein